MGKAIEFPQDAACVGALPAAERTAGKPPRSPRFLKARRGRVRLIWGKKGPIAIYAISRDAKAPRASLWALAGAAVCAAAACALLVARERGSGQ